MPKAKQQFNDPMYQILKTTQGNRPRAIKGIVGDFKRGFAEEGLVLLDLEGKVLAIYDRNTDKVKDIPGLSREEREAANFLGMAYGQIRRFCTQNGIEPRLYEVKYLAATLAMPIERIREYAGRRSLEDVTSKELGSQFGVPIELAKLRAETLKLRNPDMYLDIRGVYERRDNQTARTTEDADGDFEDTDESVSAID